MSPSGGGKLKDIRQQIRTMLKYEDPPNILIIHVAGNDIGATKTIELCIKIKRNLSWSRCCLPSSMLVWSQILPHLKWRYSENLRAMDIRRNRVNSSIASFLMKNSGSYIRNPEIKANEKFFEDGVHLSSLGNEIFLNTLQGGIESIVKNWDSRLTFPNRC